MSEQESTINSSGFNELNTKDKRIHLKTMNNIYSLKNPEDKNIFPNNLAFKSYDDSGLIDIFNYNFNGDGTIKENIKARGTRTQQPKAESSKVSQQQQEEENYVKIDPESLYQLAQLLKQKEEQDIEEEITFLEPQREDFLSQGDYERSYELWLERKDYYEKLQQKRQKPLVQGDIEDLQSGISGSLEETTQQLTQQINNVNDYLSPYRNKTKEDIINEYERIGILYYDNLDNATKKDLGDKLDFIKKIEIQSKALNEYKKNNPPYIEKDYIRSGFDMFYKIGETAPNNTPLNKSYKFIQKIPDINIKFNPKTGFYDCTQGKEKYIAKNYRLADKWATLGGFYTFELQQLRTIKIKQDNLNDKFYPIFKARKI